MTLTENTPLSAATNAITEKATTDNIGFMLKVELASKPPDAEVK